MEGQGVDTLQPTDMIPEDEEEVEESYDQDDLDRELR